MENINTDFALPSTPFSQQLSSKGKQQRSPSMKDCLPWAADGIALPHGTKLRGKYKGHTYHGRVHNGVFILNGKEFLTPCAAAITITRNPVDGWLFWDCQKPDQLDWVCLYDLKNSEH